MTRFAYTTPRNTQVKRIRRMTIIKLLLLIASAMTNFSESRSLVQAKKKTTCGIRRLDAFDMMLTCYFHDNISDLQKDFTVYLYKEQQSPKAVVSCQWTPEVSCYVAPGYEYEYDIVVNHDHANVRVLHATTEHVGMYTCQVMGDSDPGTCMLTEKHIPRNSTLTPNTQQTSMTVRAQTTTTSSLPDDRQTQRADEQSSVASKLSAPKDEPGGSPAEEHKQTGSQDSTVVAGVPSVVLPVLLTIITIIAVIVTSYCWSRQGRSPSTVNEGSEEREREEETILLNERQHDEHHSDISPPNPEDSQLTAQEDRQQTPVESGRQHETEVKTRCKTDGDSCLEADSKPLMSESFELENHIDAPEAQQS